MSDPVVVLLNGVPISGNGAITTLGQTLLDGANLTLGITTDAAVAAGAAGTQQAKLRALSRDIGTVNTLITSTNTKLDSLLSGLGAPGALAFGNSTSIVPAFTSDATKARVTSAASVNNTLVNAAARLLRSIDIYNEAVYAVYLKLYDKATAPVAGTDTPFWTIPIPANSGYSKSFVWGIPLTSGLGYAITKLKADSDTTVIAANDATGMMTWR